MEMRPVRAPALANLTDHLALFDALAVLHPDGVHVDVDGVETETVLDHHRTSGQHHVGMGNRNDTVRRCADRCADWRGDVEAHVRRAWRAVEDALASVHTGN